MPPVVGGNFLHIELEPILKALESLAPEHNLPRYFIETQGGIDGSKENEETKKWLRLIDGLDRSARTLIRIFLAHAAEQSTNKGAEWVALAKNAGADADLESTVIRFITHETAILEESDTSTKAKGPLDDRIKQLEAFGKMALEMASSLRNNNSSKE